MIEFPLFAPFLLLHKCFFGIKHILVDVLFLHHLWLLHSPFGPFRERFRLASSRWSSWNPPGKLCRKSSAQVTQRQRWLHGKPQLPDVWDVPSTNHWTIDRVRLRLESYNHGLFNPKKLVFKPYNYGTMSTYPSTDRLTWETSASWPMLNTFHTFIDLKWWRHSCDARATWVSICACWRQITGLWDAARIV